MSIANQLAQYLTTYPSSLFGIEMGLCQIENSQRPRIISIKEGASRLFRVEYYMGEVGCVLLPPHSYLVSFTTLNRRSFPYCYIYNTNHHKAHASFSMSPRHWRSGKINWERGLGARRSYIRRRRSCAHSRRTHTNVDAYTHLLLLSGRV